MAEPIRSPGLPGRRAGRSARQVPLPPAARHERRRRRRTRSMDGRPVISLSSNNYLGLATHPHLVEAALAAVRDLGVGSGRGADDRRHDGAPRGARAAAGRLQAHRGGPDLPVGLHRQQRRHPDHHRRARPDRQRRAEPRLDHRRRAPVARRPEPSTRTRTWTASRAVLREARAKGGPTGAYRAHPGHHRRRLQHGRRHRAAARDLRRRRALRGGRDGRRRARLGRAGPQRPRHDRPLRSARPGRHPGRARSPRRSACSAATSPAARPCATT